MRVRLGLSIGLLVSATTGAWGQWAVVDTAQIVEMAKQFQQQLSMYREMIEHTRQQTQQIQNQIQQIMHAYTTVQHGAKNLLTLDLNSLADLLDLSQQLERKLDYAEYLGYRSAQSWEQAQALYPKIQQALSGQAQRDIRRTWAASQRSTARTALETQSIVEAHRRQVAAWQEAIQRAVGAQGALQIEQAQAQMLALQGTHLQQIQQHLATQARQTTEQVLEKATQTELELTAAEAATGAYNMQGFTPAGRLLAMPRTGQE